MIVPERRICDNHWTKKGEEVKSTVRMNLKAGDLEGMTDLCVTCYDYLVEHKELP
jgi:hypothetical protein